MQEDGPPSATMTVPDLTRLLQAAAHGDRAAVGQLFEATYADLLRIARALLRSLGDAPALDPTAVVHDAFLRLWGGALPHFDDREHFLAYAARAMRSVVIDSARARGAASRGGDVDHTAWSTQLGDNLPAAGDDLRPVHEALQDLAAIDPRLARVVDLRYFAGMTDAEIAVTLGVAERTVQRDWGRARLLLEAALRTSP